MTRPFRYRWPGSGETTRRALPLGARLGLAFLLSGAYALGALLPFWYLASPSDGAAFFPPAGLTVSVLMLSPRRTWPWWLLLFGATELAVDLTHDQSLAKSIGFALANTLEPLVGALAVRWAFDRWHETLRAQLVAFVVGAAVAGPIVGGVIGASTAYFLGDAGSWFTVAGTWFLGDALGVLFIATPILAWSRRSRYEPVARPLEIAAFLAAVLALAIVPAVLWHHPMLYAVLPVLMVAAFRGGLRAVSTAGVGLVFAANWAAVTDQVDSLIAPSSTGRHLVYVQILLAVTLLAALVLAIEVAERRRIEEVVRRSEAERLDAERVAIEIANTERRRLLRETHDVVGHALSVMLLQAGAARRTLNGDVGPATRELLESIETAGRSAFRDLDAVLAVAPSAPATAPSRDIESLLLLVEVMRQAGMDIEMRIEGDPVELPSIVEWSTYRIVQEALTNVAKHAPAARARVTITFGASCLRVSVVDDGDPRAKPSAFGQGRGLIGMGERVAALGGRFEVGPHSSGFAVRAELPVREPSP